MSTQAPVIVWFRNDLRLHDQAALSDAARGGAPVLGVYVLDDAAAGAWALGGAARWWLHHSLAALAEGLGRHGVKLVLRRGDTAAELADIAAASGAADIHTGGAMEPHARRAEKAVAALPSVTLHRHRTVTLFDPEAIKTQSGGVYGVFTPFSRACRARGVAEPRPLPRTLVGAPAVRSDTLADWALLPTKPDWAAGLRATWTPGEHGAASRLKAFRAHIAHYDVRRNLPGEPGTSMLSPHLHWGEVSPAQVWHAAEAAESGKGVETYQTEVIWREFSQYLLWHNPTLPERPLRPEFAKMATRTDHAELDAWQRGRTGVPIVDAGMRQLWQTGWMHNRVRMIVASFLVKHLLLPWRDGEAWFWNTLVDADLGSNAASWQWVAGCGADAAPFFRVFNPALQGQKFDPDGTYVRQFVPELARLDTRYLHAPWDTPALILQQSGIVLGEHYPHPLVDLAHGRERALAAYRALPRAG